MSVAKKGQAKIVARARLMLLLGEQLITDEVAAISELVKNAYDADATKTIVTLFGLSEPKEGYIIVRDNGHGMTHDQAISSWLELGTLSKARGPDRTPQLTESGKRVCLGEKGLGRLAVHKLGYWTELVTRRTNSKSETRLVIDWTAYEQTKAFLGDIPVDWEVRTPQVFTGPGKQNGTQITVRQLRRKWNPSIIKKVHRNILSLKSPFADLTDFDIQIDIEDKLAPKPVPDWIDIIKTATYRLIGEVDSSGRMKFEYTFSRSDLPDLKREKNGLKDIRDPEQFSGDRKPLCGPFSLRFYVWDLLAKDKRAVLGDAAIYDEMIRPNSGIKVFRDGFRVLPYGNTDNDWLSMDMARVRQFEKHLSRNQIIGVVEISSEKNPQLIDKTDREGLIDNDSFRDFRSLTIGALSEFEAERFIDRRNLKEVLGRTRKGKTDRAVFSRNLTALKKKIDEQPTLSSITKFEIEKMISEAKTALDNLLTEKEQPLLVAATIGLTYMMPTHEVLRDVHEADKILKRMKKSETDARKHTQIDSVISNLNQADEIVRGIGRLMQQAPSRERFRLRKVAERAIDLMRFKFARNSIKYEILGSISLEAKGSERLMIILLLNLLDNSFYWLLRKKPEERRIRILIRKLDGNSALIVSDSGPGFEDDEIDIVTLPFFTRKPKGIGLGLYIADRIAKMNQGKLKLISQDDFPDLLSGGNIGVFLPKIRK